MSDRPAPAEDFAVESRGASAGHGAVRARTHLRFGWWGLLVFLSLGIVLEVLHAFKAGWYLDVGHEARRLMLRLAHAHGTLLSLVNVAFGLTHLAAPPAAARGRVLASRCLMSATILMPVGFFLGGIFIYDGDPGLGAWLVPPGAALLFIAVVATAASLSRSHSARRSDAEAMD